MFDNGKDFLRFFHQCRILEILYYEKGGIGRNKEWNQKYQYHNAQIEAGKISGQNFRMIDQI